MEENDASCGAWEQCHHKEAWIWKINTLANIV